MNLELTTAEAILLARVLVGWNPQTVTDADLLIQLARRLCALPVPMGSDGPKGAAEHVTGAEFERRSSEALAQSGDEPKRSPQIGGAGAQQCEAQRRLVESVRMSTTKYDREAVEQITLTPAKCERKDATNGPYIRVSWQSRGRGYMYASCWDPELFAWVAGRVQQETVFYVVHKDKYTNIVGVKA